MNPCGVIVTYIDWKKVKKWFFNIPLFIYQLTFMIAGTAYGKIRWRRRLNTVSTLILLPIAISMWFISNAWWNGALLAIILFIGIPTIRNIDWRRVWQAAQASHVRLSLRKLPDAEVWEYINFGIDGAEIQRWTSELILNLDPKRFRYFDPTFPTPPEFVEPIIQYAHDQVGKRYDELQLISNGLHLIAWIIWPWSWGKELKIIKAFNRKGGLEHCISGVTACLRWGEPYSFPSTSLSFADIRKAQESLRRVAKAKVNKKYLAKLREYTGKFFPGYSTATTSPCLVPLSKNWRQSES